MSTKQWGHRLFLSSYRGKTRGYCSCGKQYKAVPNEESASIAAEHVEHTGLIEHRPKNIT